MAFNRLLKYAKLDPTEEKDFRLLFVQSLLSGFGGTFFFVVVSSYFIKLMSPTRMPPAYILSGVIGYVLIAMYKKLQSKSGVINSYVISFVVYALSAIVLYFFRVSFADTSPVAFYIAYIGFIIVLPLSAIQSIGFSTVCLRIFNIAQSKRLLALIGTGEIIAAVLAYLLVPFLTKLMNGSTAYLLILSAITNLASILPLKKIYQFNKEKLDTIRFSTAQKKMDVNFFIKDKFYLLIAVVTLLSVMAVYFADYSYMVSVRYLSIESETDVAIIFARIYCLIKIGELSASLLSGSIIRSYGMKISLMLLPVILVLSTVIGFSTSVIFKFPEFIVFFLLFNKWCERAIRKGVTVPSMKVIYQVTDPEDRAQLQTSIDGTITQYATIIAGLLVWGFSFLLKSDDLPYFLEIIAFIYIIAFGLWSWFTLLLFNNYKIKIKEYLRRFRHKAAQVVIAEFEADAEIEVVEKETHEHYGLVKQALDNPLPVNLKSLSQYISYYNPNVRASTGETSILKKAKNAYYNNENFFSRLLIIWYIELQDKETIISFVKEYYGISELQLRVEIVSMLNKTSYKIRPEDSFFFTGLCQDIATEIMWVESSINDIKDQVDTKLVDALKDQILTLQSLLFEILKVLYDRESIDVVEDIMNAKDQAFENRLFAVELLDNVLETEMKKLLMPVIEDISYNAKKEKLQKTLLIYDLSAGDRLKEILMANFMTIGPYIKQLALEEYYKVTHDKHILSAFAASYVENLNATAAILLYNSDDLVYLAKHYAVETLMLAEEINPNTLAYFVKWGLFTKTRKKGNTHINEYLGKQTYQFNQEYIANIKYENVDLSIDLLGLALLYKINPN